MRHALIPVIASFLLSNPQLPPAVRITTSAPAGFVVLRFHVDEAARKAEQPNAIPAAAIDVMVDGRKDQSVVLTLGATRSSYDALLGPLKPGAHEVRLEPSSLWSWDNALRVSDVSAEVVPAGDRRNDLFAHAPAIGLRPDTIGTASDLPLMLYVEDAREPGARWLKYSIIFSNEDGGTPGAALMARWGRTTDIELAYEVELRGGKPAQARYQGPDHRVMPRARLDAPPLLLVSTLNNMFLDRGHAETVVRMVPALVDLSTRSRESVMDERPWMYRVMARELESERPVGVGDPRDYLYVDLKLTSRHAAVALGARSADGITNWSDRGRADLAVARQGEIRIAIPSRRSDLPAALTVRCDSRPDANQASDSGSFDKIRAGQCTVELRKAFRLDNDYQPGANVIAPERLTIDSGLAREMPIIAGKIRE